MSLAAPLDVNMLPEPEQAQDWLGPQTGAAENFSAVFDSQNDVNSSLGLENMYNEALQARDDEVFKLTGKRFGVSMQTPLFDQYGPFQNDEQPLSAIAARYSEYPQHVVRKAYERATEIEKQLDELRKQFPQIKTRRNIFDDVSAKRAEIEGKAANIGARAGFLGAVGGFAGGMAGSFTLNNPENIATATLGGFGKTALQRIGSEALVQMAIEGSNQLEVSKDYADMGERLSGGQIAQNVLLAGGGGALFRGAAEGGGAILKNLRERAETKDSAGKLAEEIINAKTPDERAAIIQQADVEDVAVVNDILNPVKSTAQRGAVQAAEVEAFTAKENPFSEDGAINADKAHNEMLAGATVALETDRPVAMPNLVSDIYKRVPVETFEVQNLTVDAPAMQFKGGGDDMGVTDRLKGTKAWSDYLAGVITVWKKEDGTVVVADGHQRVGFAKRLMAANPEQKISIPAFVFKESDGDSQAFVRAAAALRNISEGSGSALDASKVFKDMPSKAKAVFDSLPPNSAIVKQGLNLASLDNEAYLMVVNGVVPDRIGAVVGRLEENTDKQRALMALLAKEEPDTVFQAEEIVRQAQQAGFDTTEQATLFGSESVTESLFKDKAKVLERSLNLIKSDIKTFRNLLNNSDRISEVGNALNNSANAAILGDSNAILQTVQALAYRKGPIADLLTQAAKEAKTNGRYKQGAERFVEALRGRMDEGGLSGIVDGSEGDLSNIIAEVTRRIESENVASSVVQTSDLFNEQPKTIEGGYSELVAARDAQAAPASRKAESETGGAKANSSKSTSVVGSQDLVPGANLMERRPPSAVFSTAKNSPPILTGLDSNRGIKDTPIRKVYHVANNKATLLAKAREYEKPLGEWLTGEVADIRGAKFEGARVKNAADVENKISKGKRKPSEISDYLGARIAVDSMEAADAVVAKLTESAHAVEVDDFLRVPRADREYRAVHLQLEAKDGFSYEVQVIPRDVMDVYEKSRPYYANWKSYRGEIPPEKYAAWKKDMRKGDKIMRDGWKKFQERDLMEQRIKAFDVNDEVPISIEFDSMGNEVVKTAKLGDLMADIESHEKLLKSMTECLI